MCRFSLVVEAPRVPDTKRGEFRVLALSSARLNVAIAGYSPLPSARYWPPKRFCRTTMRRHSPSRISFGRAQAAPVQKTIYEAAVLPTLAVSAFAVIAITGWAAKAANCALESNCCLGFGDNDVNKHRSGTPTQMSAML